MLNPADFSFTEARQAIDFRGFVLKTLSYWKWLLLGALTALGIAYQVNVRSQKVYLQTAVIAVNEENNPLFTSNTSLIFNWGGTSDKVQTIASTLQSRLHNEVVVSQLRFYVEYLSKEPYYWADAYGRTPFEVFPNTTQWVPYQQLLRVVFTDATHYVIAAEAPEGQGAYIRYSNGEMQSQGPAFSAQVKGTLGVPLQHPQLHLTLQPSTQPVVVGQPYFIRFADFDQTVAHYQKIRVQIDEKAASILALSLEGTNKARMVAYLNKTVETLKQRQLEQKNQFAINTIAFIDATLQSMEGELKNAGEALKDFSRTNNVIEIERGGRGHPRAFFQIRPNPHRNRAQAGLLSVFKKVFTVIHRLFKVTRSSRGGH